VRLEAKLKQSGTPFLESLRSSIPANCPRNRQK
jgi:hypothetical protein